jgi:hypothetical protein
VFASVLGKRAWQATLPPYQVVVCETLARCAGETVLALATLAVPNSRPNTVMSAIPVRGHKEVRGVGSHDEDE